MVQIDLIRKDEELLGGEPHVAGRRISVRQIVQMVEGDYTPGEVAEELRLDRSKVDAALRYYRLNRDEIRDHIAEERELVEGMLEDSDAPAA